MRCLIPFLRALLLLSAVFFEGGCMHSPTGYADTPVPDNPSDDIPELRAWCGGTPVRMGADSACSLPVAVFPELAMLCERLGPVRNGFRTAPLPLSLSPGREPVVAYSHVVTVAGTPIQGLVGWPVLSRFVWRLDLARHHHSFYRELPQKIAAWRSLPLTGKDVARVHLPGCGECMLDTGAPYGLYLSEEEWQRFLRSHPEAEVGFYCGNSPAANGPFVRRYTTVSQMRLGPWFFRNIRVCESFSPRTGPRMIGRESLAQLELWLDGPASRLYYRPVPLPVKDGKDGNG